MKKQILVVGISLITTISFGQKKEIKKAQKAVKSGNYTEAITLLDTAEGLLGSADNDLKADFYATKGDAYLGSAGTSNFDKMKTAADAFLMAIDLDNGKRAELSGSIEKLKAALVNSAIKDQESKKFSLSADKLYTSYKINSQDTSYLYFAASNEVNGKNYDKALIYYKELLNLGYTGATKKYYGVNKKTGEEISYDDKNTRDLMLKAGEIIKPTERVQDSRLGEILRNMTLIYIEKGETAKAKELISKALSENPDDLGLMRANASIQKELGNMEGYNKIMNEIIAKNPNDPNTYISLAESESENENFEKAAEYYEKVLELEPNNSAAMINIGVMKLKREGDIVEEMNSLGTSRADNERYDVLKAERDQIYRDVLPYFENAKNLEKDNVGLLKTLMNIYSQLGEDAKFKEMKALVEQKEG